MRTQACLVLTDRTTSGEMSARRVQPASVQIVGSAVVEATPVMLDTRTGTLRPPPHLELPAVYTQEALKPGSKWRLASQQPGREHDQHAMLARPFAFQGSVPRHDAYVLRFEEWQRACFVSPAVLQQAPPWLQAREGADMAAPASQTSKRMPCVHTKVYCKSSLQQHEPEQARNEQHD
jgi:hypothetical protein